MKKKVRRFTYKNLNVPKIICNHVIGEEHGKHHRVIAGAVLMIFGVFVAKIPAGHILGHVFFEAVGFLFHCVGAIPMVQIAETVACKREQPKDETIEAEDYEA